MHKADGIPNQRLERRERVCGMCVESRVRKWVAVWVLLAEAAFLPYMEEVAREGWLRRDTVPIQGFALGWGTRQ